MGKFILDENQHQRDQELAEILGLPYPDVVKLRVCTVNSLQIFKEGEKKPEDIADLYKSYDYLHFTGYLKTLMFTSATRRHKELFLYLRAVKSVRCLDFGSGTGTHTIAMLQNKNIVDSLDVKGKLQDFLIKRLERRGLKANILYHTDSLPKDTYYFVVCTDTLEHVSNPFEDIKRIYDSMKESGVLHLVVSSMVKPSGGHFVENITIWKKQGLPFLKKHFKQIGETTWVKK